MSNLEIVKQNLSEILTRLGVNVEPEIEIEPAESRENDENANRAGIENYIKVNINDEAASKLIGYHGKTVEGLGVILNLMLIKEKPEAKDRVIVDVNEYKAGREEYFVSLAERARDDAMQSGQEVHLQPMKPAERRVVHMTLKQYDDISTESMGEGMDRHIVVKPN